MQLLHSWLINLRSVISNQSIQWLQIQSCLKLLLNTKSGMAWQLWWNHRWQLGQKAIGSSPSSGRQQSQCNCTLCVLSGRLGRTSSDGKGEISWSSMHLRKCSLILVWSNLYICKCKWITTRTSVQAVFIYLLHSGLFPKQNSVAYVKLRTLLCDVHLLTGVTTLTVFSHILYHRFPVVRLWYL